MMLVSKDNSSLPNAMEMGDSSYRKPLLTDHSTRTTASYGSSSSTSSLSWEERTVRFQVVLWHVGPIDAVLGTVRMKFRVTIFWNAPSPEQDKQMSLGGYGHYDCNNKRIWTMHGRQRAYQRELSEIIPDSRVVYVPPISILNAVDFELAGDPEVCLVNEAQQTFKWTAMYSASLVQDLDVRNFPHDQHTLVIRLGIMKHRQPGKRWDRNIWKLGLATEQDSQNTIRVAHGLTVDHVNIPEFNFDRQKGLKFEMEPLRFGPQNPTTHAPADESLAVKLHITRNSGYYDKNIIPLLAMLNLVGAATLCLDATEFGSRGEILLAAAFVEIGIRMTVDNKLPNAGYEIKLQRTLTYFFYILLLLHCESALVYYLRVRCQYEAEMAELINDASIVGSILLTTGLTANYYFGTR